MKTWLHETNSMAAQPGNMNHRLVGLRDMILTCTHSILDNKQNHPMSSKALVLNFEPKNQNILLNKKISMQIT